MAKNLRSFFANISGGVLIYGALAMPILLGATGLSTDVALWYSHKRIIQSAADSAAVAGALEVMRTADDGHEQVGHHQLDRAVAQSAPRGPSVRRLRDRAAEALQGFSDRPSHPVVVLDQKDAQACERPWIRPVAALRCRRHCTASARWASCSDRLGRGVGCLCSHQWVSFTE